MVGCIPETIPVEPGNPDEKINTTKSVDEAKEIAAPVKKKGHTVNRAKKADETE